MLGGSGFVGSAICKAAISKGIEVVSVSRYYGVEIFVLILNNFLRSCLV